MGPVRNTDDRFSYDGAHLLRFIAPLKYLIKTF